MNRMIQKVIVAGVIVAIVLSAWMLIPHNKKEGKQLKWWSNTEKSKGDWWYDPPDWMIESGKWDEFIADKGFHAKVKKQPIALSKNITEFYVDVEYYCISVYNLTVSADAHGLPLEIYFKERTRNPWVTDEIIQEWIELGMYDEYKDAIWDEITHYIYGSWDDDRASHYYLLAEDAGTDGAITFMLYIEPTGIIEGKHNITLIFDYDYIDRTLPYTPHGKGHDEINVMIEGE